MNVDVRLLSGILPYLCFNRVYDFDVIEGYNTDGGMLEDYTNGGLT